MLKQIRLIALFFTLAFILTGCSALVPFTSQGKPDLVWGRNWTIEPLAPLVGDKLNIRHSFKNAGEAITPAEFAIGLKISKGNATVYRQPVLVREAAKAGEWLTIDVSPDFVISEPGDYRVTMLLDTQGAVTESNKDNNEWVSDIIRVPNLSNQTVYNKGEDAEALAQAEENIEKYRKGDVTLTVVDSAGQPRSGLTVEYTQTQHSFLFGAFSSMPNQSAWAFMKEAGVNYATMQFGWAAVEPSPGVYQLESWRTDILQKFSFAGMGHALIFLTNIWPITPDYILQSSFEQFRNAVYPHIYKVVSAYSQDVKIWNVFNEPMYRDANILGLTSQQTIEIIKEGTRAIRDADPNARILINNFNVGGEIPGVYPYDFLKGVVQSSVDFDIIGLELYYNAYMTEGFNAHLRRTLKAQAELIDKYSTLGKKIIITELSVPSASTETMKGYWGQPWSEDLQAEYLKSAYTLFFSKPQVEGITWWDTFDGKWTFIYHGALLNEQNRPKKSYYALKNLIKSWTTKGIGVSDSDGQLSFRGFGGSYVVTITDPRSGLSKEHTVPVEEQKANSFTIKFD